MPIISISKIQHRYGLIENLPQLAAAELGWAIDKRKLYIGNGPTNEGAPTIGNTEILTQYSNLLEVAENSYSYKDLAVGFEAITGQSIASPITRNLQAKLDDFANVRDYGAKGDGLTDDTEAIIRALTDLFIREPIPAVRRVLYFPAGNYLVSNVIKIPPYATLQGEGKNCTFITATDNTADCVARIVDSKLQTGANIGANGAVYPCYVAINDLTFNANSLGINVFLMNSAQNIAFRNVSFDGGSSVMLTVEGNRIAALKILSTAIAHSKNITFDVCEFSGTNYAVILDDDMENIIFDKCSFKQLFTGLKIGENTLGTGASRIGPVGLRVTNSLFDKIYASGFINYSTAKVTSAFNTYLDVGNKGISDPTYSNIVFSADGSASICDLFDRGNDVRPAAIDGQISNSITWMGTWTPPAPANVNIIGSNGMTIGSRKFEYGSTVVLSSNAVAPTVAFTLPQANRSQRVYYILERSNEIRQGYLDIVCPETAYTVQISDTFTENQDIGITFTATSDPGGTGLVSILYTSDSNDPVVLRYSIERLSPIYYYISD